jgi:hypothetical protein
LQRNIFVEIVEALGSFWDEMYGRLVAYYKDVNSLHTKDRALSRWVAEQRRKKRQGLLSAERIEKLDQIGFNWKGEDLLKTAWGRTQVVACRADQAERADWCNSRTSTPISSLVLAS